jgi:hypothetical protein
LDRSGARANGLGHDGYRRAIADDDSGEQVAVPEVTKVCEAEVMKTCEVVSWEVRAMTERMNATRSAGHAKAQASAPRWSSRTRGPIPEQLTALRRGHIGFVFQSYHLFPTLTAMDDVRLALDVRGDYSRRAFA